MTTSAPRSTVTYSRAERSALTAQLLGEAQGCRDPELRAEIMDRVILINRGVAEAVASRYRGRGIADDDLRQAAYEGLTKAVKRFDPALRNDLLTYAVPTIRGEVRRYFRDRGWVVRPPRRIQELQWQINQTTEEQAHALGRDPDECEVIDALGIDRVEYDEAIAAFGCFQPSSLDQALTPESTTTLGDALRSDHDAIAASEARVTLAPVVRRLPERERKVLYLRFFEDRTQAQIGQELGVTQMQVSRLLNRILAQLRAELDRGSSGMT